MAGARRLPSGRKAIAHGSSKVAISVLAKGRELLVAGSAAAWDAAWEWSSCALAGCPGALPGVLPAIRARLAQARASRRRGMAERRFMCRTREVKGEGKGEWWGKGGEV